MYLAVFASTINGTTNASIASGAARRYLEGLLAFLIQDAGIKSLALLVLTAISAWLMRRHAAATVHRLWTLAFCGLIVVPLLGPILPTCSLPVVPKAWGVSTGGGVDLLSSMPNSASDFQSLSAAAAGDNAVELSTVKPGSGLGQNGIHRVSGLQTKSEGESVANPDSTSVGNANVALSRGYKWLKLTWATYLLSFWGLGTSVCLLRILRDHIRLRRILHRGESVQTSNWNEAQRVAAAMLGVNQNVELCQVPFAMSPMITGIWRPLIILPEDASTWDSERRRLVLLHEMAHARRYDVLSQTMAQLVCAVYWFNPIVWYGLSQMRKLRELACDDLVLESGQRASDYAHVLLDVAKSSHQRGLMTAVGMARRNDVESRIMALLDSVRSHVSLTKRTARGLLVVTTIIVALIGSVRLQTRADQKPEQASTPEFRKMTINVRDEKGTPLANTDIKVGVWELNDKKTLKPTLEYKTGENGSVEIKLPQKLHILRVFPTRAKFVPVYINIDRGNSDIGPDLPKSFDFVMQPSVIMGGRVVDDLGKPIAGVRVLLTASSIRTVEKQATNSFVPKPEVNTREETVTDEHGQWKVDGAPKESPDDKYEIQVHLNHPDFDNDLYVFNSQHNYVKAKTAHGMTTATLQSGEANFVLSRGTVIDGTVVDSMGKPIKNGLIVWKNVQYPVDQKGEISISEDGEFRTPGVPPGEHPITVIAPGYMPEVRKVRVPESTEKLHVVMKPGKRLAIKFVNAEGKPVPNVRLHIERWRGLFSLDNSKTPKRANYDGLYVWDWAPGDAVTYRTEAPGMASKTISLAANDSEHVVTLNRPLQISGRIRDVSTGKPIPKFSAIPVIAFRPEFLRTDFNREVSGRDGQFEIKDFGSAGDDRKFRIRIEAEGYRTLISDRVFEVSDGPENYKAMLSPAPALPGQVVDPSGKSIAGAAVIYATPTVVPNLVNNQLTADKRIIATDAEGRFQIASSVESAKLVVIHDSGYAEVDRKVDEAPGKVSLQPWAKISGTLKQNGSPVGEQTIFFGAVTRPKLGEPMLQVQYRSFTDANGHFEFDRLPPIAANVYAGINSLKGSPLTSTQEMPLVLKPGENRVVSLGSQGITVTGKVVASGHGDMEQDKKWSRVSLIRRGAGIDLPANFPSGEFDTSKPLQLSWTKCDHFHDWLNTKDRYSIQLAPDGSFSVSGVPAGEYDLFVALSEMPDGYAAETVGDCLLPIAVSELDVAAGKKDVGRIDIEYQRGPRIGQNMRNYQFVDVEGRQQSVFDVQGQYVLIHVWSSWSSRCMNSMPEIQSTVKKTISSGKRITFVGINIDDDQNRPKELAIKNKWDWSQKYLGGNSDITRRLAIGYVPTYYLIDQEGRLVASTNDWSTMQGQIESLEVR